MFPAISITNPIDENTTSTSPPDPPITPECSVPSPSPPSLDLPSTDTTILRKSAIIVKNPTYFQDYVHNTIHLAPVSSNYFSSPVSPPFFSFSGLSSSN